MNRCFIKNKPIILLSLCLILACCILGLFACGEKTPSESIPHTITFSVEGESFHSIKTKGNEVLTLPENPKKSKHTFVGWFFDDQTFTKKFTAESYVDKALSSNTTVYAQFLLTTENTAQGKFTLSSDGDYYVFKAPSSNTIGQTFTVPNTFNDRPVLELSEGAFSGFKPTPHHIILPDGLKKIGKWAFNQQYFITELVIPNSVEEIGAKAFDGCINLISISLPDSLRSVGEGIFAGCFKLENITIGKNLAKLDGTTFSGCSALKHINVHSENPYLTVSNNILYTKDLTTLICAPANVNYGNLILPTQLTTISTKAFLNNKNLSSITFNDNLSTISESAFEGSSLSTVILPNNLTALGKRAFAECREITYLKIGKTIEEIPQEAFINCQKLSQIKFDETGALKIIGKSAFESCISLASLTLPNSVETLKLKSFRNCSSLMNVTIGSGVKHIEGGSEIMGDEGTYKPNSAFSCDEAHNNTRDMKVTFARPDFWRATNLRSDLNAQIRVYCSFQLNTGKPFWHTDIEAYEITPKFVINNDDFAGATTTVGKYLLTTPFHFIWLENYTFSDDL